MAHVAGTVDIEDRFEPTICCDIRSLCPHAVRKLYGRPDFLWFSPPCTEFSRLNRKKRQERDYEVALALVERCLEFIHILQPSRGFVIENPRGGDLESFAVLKMVKKNAFDYCCFGPFPKKPTTLWNNLHHLQDQRCNGHRSESHHAGGKHRYRIKGVALDSKRALRGEAAAVIPPGLAERVYEAVGKQAQTPERISMGSIVSAGLSPFDDGWSEKQRAGGCNNPFWRTKHGSLTVPMAQRRRCQELRALAKRVDEQRWRSERIAEICGAFHPVTSTMVCWAWWNGAWQPGRLCDFSDMPDAGKGVGRTCLDNVLDLAKGEWQVDGKLLVNWLYEGTVSLVPSRNVRDIGDFCIKLSAQPVSTKKREALRQAKILSSKECFIQRQELKHLKRGQKLLFQYNGVFDDQIDEHNNEWFELQLVRHIRESSEDTTACLWELDVVNVTQSGRRQTVSYREHRDHVSSRHSCVLEPFDLDEAAGQGRLRRWFDWEDENETIGALSSETVLAGTGTDKVVEPEGATTQDLGGRADNSSAFNGQYAPARIVDSREALSASVLVGLHVRLLFSSSGWHHGVVQRLLTNGMLLVRFQDGDEKEYTVAKVRSALVDRLLFQRVRVPFHVPGGRVQDYDGTITESTKGKYNVEYDDGQTIGGYSKDELSEYLTRGHAEIEQQKHEQEQNHEHGQEQEVRRRHRQRAVPRRFEAGPASRSKAAGVSFFVPPHPSPAKRRRKIRRQQQPAQGDPAELDTTTPSQCNDDDPPLHDTCFDEGDQEFRHGNGQSQSELAEVDELHDHGAVAMPTHSSVSKPYAEAEATTENRQQPSQQQDPRLGTETEATPSATRFWGGVQTPIGHVRPGDTLSVRWDDKRWYRCSVVYASPARGICLRYPESEKWKPCTEVLRNFDTEVTPDNVRRCDTLEPESPRAVRATLPINHGRIPHVGDRVEVEYDEADDGDPNHDFVIYEGVCVHAAKQTLTGSAVAQRLGHASTSRLPTRFKVKFDVDGSEETIVRGKHRWRKIA